MNSLFFEKKKKSVQILFYFKKNLSQFAKLPTTWKGADYFSIFLFFLILPNLAKYSSEWWPHEQTLQNFYGPRIHFELKQVTSLRRRRILTPSLEK